MQIQTQTRLALRTFAAAALFGLFASCGSGDSDGGGTTVLIPDDAASTVTIQNSNPVANGVDLATVTIVVKANNPNADSIPDVTILVEASGTGNTVTQTVAVTDAGGMATATLASTVAEVKTITVSATFQGTTYSLDLEPQVTFVPGPASPSESTLVVTPAMPIANGIAQASLTATVQDAQGNLISGAPVTFTATGLENTLVDATGNTNAVGVRVAKLASFRAGPKTVTATVGSSDPVTLTAQPVVTFESVLRIPEVEPNNSVLTAKRLLQEAVGTGELSTAGDVDFWSVPLTAGDVIEVELYSIRLDQAGWDTTVPRLTIWSADGLTKIVEHDYSGNFSSDSWGWNDELEFTRFAAEADATYMISLTQDDDLESGGEYAMIVRTLDLGELQAEASGVIAPGVLSGYHLDDETDSFTLTATGPSFVNLRVYGYGMGVRHEGAAIADYFDPEMYLADVNDNDIYNDDQYFYNPGIFAYLSEAGDFTVDVGECCGDASTPYYLELKTTPVTPIAETEPNDSRMEAQALAFGAVISGTVVDASDEGLGGIDVDSFVFDVVAGDELWIEVYGPNLTLPQAGAPTDNGGGHPIEPVLFDGLDNSVEMSEPDGGSGRYTVLIVDPGSYRLRLGSTNGPLVDYVVQVRRVAQHGFEIEPNDTAATATMLSVGNPVAGVQQGSDPDVFSVVVDQADELVVIAVQANDDESSFGGNYDLGSEISVDLSVRDSSEVLLAEALLAGSYAAQGVIYGEVANEVAFIAPAAGTYFITVDLTSFDSAGINSPQYLIRRRR